MTDKGIFSFMGVLAGAALLCGCASPSAPATQAATGPLVQKKVAYVRGDAYRAGQMFRNQLSEPAYRELDQSVGNALRSVYSEVVAVNSANDAGAGVAYVFTPEIVADFSAPSPYRSPTAVFNTQVEVAVTNPAGAKVASLKANGAGKASFDEFRYDPGLAARRASTDLTAKLGDEIRRSAQLQ